MEDINEIPIHHSVEDIDKKYKDKSLYRNTFYNYDDHSDTFTALNNHHMSIPFPYTDREYRNSL
ncbi:hypothetical protein [Clostridium thermarum]|uniref:hypothetical protein n=1 Tax=Clostridium thermarum TaxID=1716543 RepID=UPI001123799C|nr:hypothetical protein [Clostridium thermarum]